MLLSTFGGEIGTLLPIPEFVMPCHVQVERSDQKLPFCSTASPCGFRSQWAKWKKLRVSEFFFGVFFRPTQNMGPDGPKWAQEDFFLLIQTLPTFWAERTWILRIFILWNFLDPKFRNFQVPDFQVPRNLAWAGPGWWPSAGRGAPRLGRAG